MHLFICWQRDQGKQTKKKKRSRRKYYSSIKLLQTVKIDWIYYNIGKMFRSLFYM